MYFEIYHFRIWIGQFCEQMNEWRFMIWKSFYRIGNYRCRFVPNSNIWIWYVTRIYWLQRLNPFLYQTDQDQHKQKTDSSDIPEVFDGNWLTSILYTGSSFHWNEDYPKNDFPIRSFYWYGCHQIQRESNSWNRIFLKSWFHILIRVCFQTFDCIVKITHNIWFRWGHRIIRVVNCLS